MYSEASGSTLKGKKSTLLHSCGSYVRSCQFEHMCHVTVMYPLMYLFQQQKPHEFMLMTDCVYRYA